MSRASAFYDTLTSAGRVAFIVAVTASLLAILTFLAAIGCSYAADWFDGRERRRAERAELTRQRQARIKAAMDLQRRVWLATPATDAELHRMMDRYQYELRRESKSQHPSQQPGQLEADRGDERTET